MKNSLTSDIDAQTADALFSDPQALETLLQSDIPDALIEPETPTAIKSETPVTLASESPVAAQAERLPEKLASPRSTSIMERTITRLKQSFGVGQQRTRRRPSFAFANIEGLEPRMLMAGVAAEVGMLDPSAVTWSQGKNDATQVLGKADILPGCNLYDVAISPDGTKAVVTGQFSKASIIDTKTGTVITPLAGHTSSVMNAAWSPDGSAFFTASYDKRVRHYAVDGSLLWASGDLEQLAVGVDVSPDGNTLFVRRHDMKPLVVDIATKASTTLNAPYYVGDLDVLADGTVLLLENDTRQYRGANNRVNIIDPATGMTEWTGSLSGMQPTTAVATPSGAYVFAGMDDGSIIMHDRAKGTSVSVAGHSSYVRDLAMDKTGTFLIAATNGSLTVYDVQPLMAGTGNAVPTSFPLGSSSVTVSGTVALINNTYDGASSRTLAIDLSQVPNLQARLDALTPKDEPEEDIAETPTEPVTETRMETITEAKKIDFSSLEQGVHPESWTTNIDGLGKVTMWFQGGVNVGNNGVSAVIQPLGGTGFWIKFNDGPVKVLSAEMQYDPTTKGLLRIQDERDYIYENGKMLGWPLAPTVDLGGRSIKLFDGGQNSGKLSVKSLTVEVTVTREVEVAVGGTDAVMTENTLLSDIDTLSQSWSLDGKKNRVSALTERAAALRQAAKEVVAMEGNVDTDSLQQMASTLLTSIEEYVSVEKQVFAEGFASLSPSMQAVLRQSTEELQLIASRIDLLSPNRIRNDTSSIIDTFAVPDLGGTISVHGLKGSSISALQQTSQTVEGMGVVTETGRALALDFGSLSSPVLRASFTVTSSLPTDQVRVSFLRDSGVVEEQTVTSGDLVTYENESGITGVVMQNVTDVLSTEAKAYQEYLRTYRSPNLYSWQDPGPQYRYFVSVRKDLYHRQAEIVAEVKRGEGSHPVSVSDISVTMDLAQTQEASPLSVTTNALYATMALPQLTTFPFPYGGFGGVTKVSYDPNAYNVYSLKIFGGAPEISGMSYVDASGQIRALPPQFYAIHGNSITVFPTGQQLQIGVSVKNGTGYSPSMPVGQNYDYEVLTKAGPSMAEALPVPEARISFDDIRLMTVNEGPSAGWHSGASLRYNTASPVAVGPLKAQAQITNAGAAAAGFTVKVYSGNTGTSGWDTMQYSYNGTLAGGESRSLVTPFTPMTDSQGRSFIRFVVVGDDGRILAEHGRTVGAPGGVMSAEDNRVKFLDFMKNWTTAMEHAQTETAAYFASLGEPAPTMGSPTVMKEQIIASDTDTSRMPDPAMTEHILRLAMRALTSAKESGDATRIATEQARFNEAISAHNAAISVVMATPSARASESVRAVLEKERVESMLHGAAWERANEGLMEERDNLFAWIDVRVAMGPITDSALSITQKALLGRGGDLGSADELVGDLNLSMEPGSSRYVTFTPEQDSMVNFWTPSVKGRDLTLTIQGKGLPSEGYSSKKAGQTGESISIKLLAGVQYTMTVQDSTEHYGKIINGKVVSATNFTAPLSMEIKHFNSAEIVGRISLEGNDKTMPVSMRVAEFAADENNELKRKTNYNLDPKNGGVNKLDPTKPVWVVVHGMNDSEKGGMERVARELRLSSMQVVTIDWEDAADSILFLGTDAPWTKSVGEWVAARLIGMGFDPSHINFAGHSHGTYVGYAMANKVMELKNDATINAFVGLDPAGNVPLLSGFKVGDMDFGKVSRNATVIEGSLAAGSNSLAGTADTAFQVDSPSTLRPSTEHALPVSTFANLLAAGRNHAQQLPTSLLLSQLMTHQNQQFESLKKNQYRDVYEGIITVDARERTDLYGNDYDDAILRRIISRQEGMMTEDIDHILPLDEIIR